MREFDHIFGSVHARSDTEKLSEVLRESVGIGNDNLNDITVYPYLNQSFPHNSCRQIGRSLGQAVPQWLRANFDEPVPEMVVKSDCCSNNELLHLPKSKFGNNQSIRAVYSDHFGELLCDCLRRGTFLTCRPNIL